MRENLLELIRCCFRKLYVTSLQSNHPHPAWWLTEKKQSLKQLKCKFLIFINCNVGIIFIETLRFGSESMVLPIPILLMMFHRCSTLPLKVNIMSVLPITQKYGIYRLNSTIRKKYIPLFHTKLADGCWSLMGFTIPTVE